MWFCGGTQILKREAWIPRCRGIAAIWVSRDIPSVRATIIRKEQSMAQAKNGDTVLVHYTGRLEDTAVFDSSTEREPLQFTIGEGRIILGFEQGVIGMRPG